MLLVQAIKVGADITKLDLVDIQIYVFFLFTVKTITTGEGGLVVQIIKI